jgi:hypothetical protein
MTHMDAVIEIDCRVAVRGNEADAIPKAEAIRGAIEEDVAELIAGPSIAGSGDVDYIGSEGSIRGEGFEARVDGNAVRVICADHRCKYRESVAEVNAADPGIGSIHKSV